MAGFTRRQLIVYEPAAEAGLLWRATGQNGGDSIDLSLRAVIREEGAN